VFNFVKFQDYFAFGADFPKFVLMLDLQIFLVSEGAVVGETDKGRNRDTSSSSFEKGIESFDCSTTPSHRGYCSLPFVLPIDIRLRWP